MIYFVTKHDNESLPVRTVVHQLIEQGIPFHGWREQRLPETIPDDLESVPALIVDEAILRALDESGRKRLENYARHAYVSILSEYASGLPSPECELRLETMMNVFSAAAGLEREEFEPLSDEVILSGFLRRADEFRGEIPLYKMMNEYHLHFLAAALELEKSPLAPPEWTNWIDSVMDSMFALLSPVGDHDQIGGLLFAPLYAQRTGNQKILEASVRLLDELLVLRPRTPEGLLSQSGFVNDPLCFAEIDTPSFGNDHFTNLRRDLVMNEMMHFFCGAFAALSTATGNPRYLDEALKLLDYVDKVHRDPADGLLYHASRKGKPLGMKWGRGTTHALMGAFYMLRFAGELPADAKRKVLAFLDRTGRALAVHQTPNGLWRNCINIPNTPEETSCTVLITYLYSWCVNHGLLDRDFYRPMLLRSRKALKCKFWRGYGSGNCRGTLPAVNEEYYLRRPMHGYVMPLIVPALLESALLKD